MAEYVCRSRDVALGAARALVPASRLGVWGLAQGARVISAQPAGPGRALTHLRLRHPDYGSMRTSAAGMSDHQWS